MRRRRSVGTRPRYTVRAQVSNKGLSFNINVAHPYQARDISSPALAAPLTRCYTGWVAANRNCNLGALLQDAARREAMERCPSG